jgi:AcrR family transcriptional regulator
MATQAQKPTRSRDRQTRRTKRALLAAADELFTEGRVPTVAEVAERADVARATAYRYFPTQEALLLETTFLGDSEPLRALPDLAGQIEDPAERVAEAVRRGAAWTLGREARLRAILRMSLDPAAGAERPGRRRHYIATLLESARNDLSPADYERLVGSLTLLFGIDPIVSIRDNSDLDPERIPDVLAWAAHALVSAALNPPGSAGGPRVNQTSGSRRARG